MTRLERLTEKTKSHYDLTRPEVSEAVETLLDEKVTDDAKAEFLTGLAQKGETAQEIAGFAEELRGRAVDPGVDPAQFGGVVLDVVGTGADMAHTFNISSCAIFVVAAAGVAVAKHGNRAVTSKCGSADVLSALGARIELEPAAARSCLETAGISFFFAPCFHPAFKMIGPVRKKLAERKQRTVFNILGPLVNPAGPTHMMIGVFDRGLVGRYTEVLKLLGLKRAMVVHGDGLDELTTLGPNTIAELLEDRIEEQTRDFRSEGFNLQAACLGCLAGGDPPTNARLVRDVLSGKEKGPRREIVLLNAAAALVVAGQAGDFRQGWDQAARLIDQGAATEKLARFVEQTNRG